ncbi:MAG: hypothetical protein E7018_05305 [Alphaproteobacteria bacterium]|nr:hypothetical protein [Alphaproteobacteria bacterium]
MPTHSYKIGLDYHGVVDKNPQYFEAFSAVAYERGHQIYIITGGPLSYVKEQLKIHNILYTEAFAILDYCQQKQQGSYQPDGSFNVPTDVWNQVKAEYCRHKKIDIHIDDSLEYSKWFTTPYCTYNQLNHSCQTDNGICINFATSALDAIIEIEEYLSLL